MKQKPSHQFYMQDFLSSPDVQMMSIEEVGCYTLLIFNLYVNGGEIISDLNGLSRLCRGMIPPENVMKKFYIRDGLLRHKRVDEELKKAAKFSKKQSENVRKRWSKAKSSVIPPYNSGITKPHTKGDTKPLPNAYFSSSFSSSKEKKTKSQNSLSTKVFADEVTKLSDFLYACISKNNPNFKGDARKWDDAIDKMLRIDKRTHEEMAQVIMFAQSDPFWQANILSGNKLREKYDQLWMKAKDKGIKSMIPKF